MKIKSRFRNMFVRLNLIILLLFSLIACQQFIPQTSSETLINQIIETGYYTSKDDVAMYLKTFNHLPYNYIIKDEAEVLGWDSDKGNLWDVSDKKSIGGDRFYNREQLLPNENGVLYYECDIDYAGGYRNAQRIVYANDGNIYYTDDHYATFELLVKGK